MRLLSGQGILMQSNDWTSEHLGSIDTGLGFVIPIWYVIAIPLVIGIWLLVWRFGRE